MKLGGNRYKLSAVKVAYSLEIIAIWVKFLIELIEPGLNKARKASQFSKR